MKLVALGDGWEAEPPSPRAMHHVSDTKLPHLRGNRGRACRGRAFIAADGQAAHVEMSMNSFKEKNQQASHLRGDVKSE